MRNAFADEITRLATADERVVLLSADIGNRLFDRFKAAAPERFHNCGVAEANMISLASGLADTGLRPVCYTIAPFITARCFEQIRVDVAYHAQPVVIVGTGAGLSYASLGATHHSLEDIALLRTLPGMQVLAPADSHELRACLQAALASPHPTYIRIGKKGEPTVFSAPPAFRYGAWTQLRAGADVALLAAGLMVEPALAAAERLAAQGVAASVHSCASIKPLDEATLAHVFEHRSLVVTLEEHGRIGGFGAAVAEWVVDRPRPVSARLLRLGTPDRFLHGGGEQDHARAELGLDPAAIAETVLTSCPTPSCSSL